MNAETGLPSFPDNYFDLAIVDPPFGEECNLYGGSSGSGKNGWKGNMDKLHTWNKPPSSDYFSELYRVSKNQIIWGANYFTQHLPTPHELLNS
jgi:site-specific DNA-methyltransferase (adenine-specific)